MRCSVVQYIQSSRKSTAAANGGTIRPAAYQLDRSGRGHAKEIRLDFVTVAFADADLIDDSIVPAFDGGNGALIVGNKVPGAQEITNGLHALTGEGAPRIELSKPVLTAEPAIEIKIGDVLLEKVDVKGKYAEIGYRYNIEWRSQQASYARAFAACSASNSSFQTVELDQLNGTDTWRMEGITISFPGEVTLRCQIRRTDIDDVRWYSEAATTLYVGEDKVTVATSAPSEIATTTASAAATGTLVPTGTRTPTARPTAAAWPSASLAVPRGTPTTAAMAVANQTRVSTSHSGAYNLNWNDPSAGLVLATSGLVWLNVDWVAGTAAGHANGEGNGSSKNVCVITIPWTYQVQYSAALSGTANADTGAILLSGKTSGTNKISPATCSCDQKKCEGDGRTAGFDAGPVTLEGILDRATGSGKGRIYVQICKGSETCQGEWHVAP